MPIKHILLYGLMILFMGSGCQPSFSGNNSNPLTISVPPLVVSSTWQVIEDGVARREYSLSTSTNTLLILYRFDTTKHSFHWTTDSSPHSLSDWSLKEPKAKLIVNGVYFQENFSPAGSVISKGKILQKTKFDLDKTAYLVLQPQPKIVDTSQDSIDESSLIEAAQSYPLFISHGQPAIPREGKQSARRTLVGFDAEQNIYIGVIPYNEITLYELMRSLYKTDIQWIDAINLDGGPSTGLLANFPNKRESIPSYTGIPNVLVVE